MWRPLLAAACLFVVTACGTSTEPTSTDPVDPGGKGDVYGSDDRREVFQSSDVYRQVARSTVVVTNPSALYLGPDGKRHLVATTFSERTAAVMGAPMCATEPFRTQPAPGHCSGFLIAPDLVATAGHCVNLTYPCEETSFVFGFAYNASTSESDVTDVPDQDFYRCALVVGHLYDQDAATLEELVSRELWSDWAVVKLDRPVTGRTPLAVRASGRVSSSARVTAVGHPGGIPTKVTGGSIVDNSHELYFNTDLDTYAGNSGSAVVNASGVVEGILVRGTGANSFEVVDGCSRSKHCAAYDPSAGSGCTGNHVMRADALRLFTGALRTVTAQASVSGDAATIPDGTGEVTVELTVTDPGTIRFATLNLDLVHDSPKDLQIVLERDNGQQAVLFSRPNLTRAGWATYSRTTGEFDGQTAAGTWRVRVRDLVANGAWLQKVRAAELVIGIGTPVQPAAGASFIGTPCTGDADCGFSDTARCHRYPDGDVTRGFCTLPCAGYCPDQAGFATTFCASLDGGATGSCLPRSHTLNQYCAALPGTTAQSMERFVGTSGAAPATATVCRP